MRKNRTNRRNRRNRSSLGLLDVSNAALRLMIRSAAKTIQSLLLAIDRNPRSFHQL
jgi:hypothetical protein